MRVFTLQVDREVWGAALSPDGRYVAVEMRRGIMVSGEPQGETEKLELWDVKQERVAHSTLLVERRGRYIGHPRFVRFSGTGELLVAFDGEALHILRVPELSLVRKIELGLPPDTRRHHIRVTGMEITSDARRAAFLVAEPAYAGGSLRVYDLVSGRLERQWQWDQGEFGSGASIAWSPDGRRLAMTWLPVTPGRKLPRYAKNLLILDADTGAVISQLNTGYLAGPVAFGPDNTVLTASQNTDDRHFKRDTIRVWDISTGKIVREIANPPEGVHYQMSVSADGKTIVAYVGLEKYDRELHGNRNIYRKFRVWDLPTGQVVTTSEPFTPLPSFEAHFFGEPEALGEGLSLALSAEGGHVLVWWKHTRAPLLIYELPTTHKRPPAS